jgi:hypothetical protein
MLDNKYNCSPNSSTKITFILVLTDTTFVKIGLQLGGNWSRISQCDLSLHHLGVALCGCGVYFPEKSDTDRSLQVVKLYALSTKSHIS